MSDYRSYEDRISNAAAFVAGLRRCIYNGYAEDVSITVSIWLRMMDVRDLEHVIAVLTELEAENEKLDQIIRDMVQLLTQDQWKEFNRIRGRRNGAVSTNGQEVQD